MSPLHEKLRALIEAGFEDACFIPAHERREVAGLYLAEASLNDQVDAYRLVRSPLEFDNDLANAYAHTLTGNELSTELYLDLRLRYTWHEIEPDIDAAMAKVRSDIAAEQGETDTLIGRLFARAG